jgi:hypothetical protein
LFSEACLLWAKKVLVLDEPRHTVGNDPFEYFFETGCEADGPVGIGIIRRFAGLGKGGNYGFFPHFRNVSVAVKSVEKSKDVFLLLFGDRFLIFLLWIKSRQSLCLSFSLLLVPAHSGLSDRSGCWGSYLRFGSECECERLWHNVSGGLGRQLNIFRKLSAISFIEVS